MTSATPTTVDAERPSVKWTDLAVLSFADKATEYSRPVALLALEWLAWSQDCLLLGSIVAFFFFLAGLRLAHDTFHGNLGVGSKADRLCLWLLSATMLGSMHAVRRTHLQHHRFCLAIEDIEAAHVGGSAWRALAYGPIFPLRLHRAAWHSNARGDRFRIAIELASTAAIVGCALALADTALRMHVAAMIVANWLTAFFAVWTVHRGCRHPHPSRTLRNRLKSKLVMDMFYHEEHHLFPRVPTARLGILAQRLDEADPTALHRMVY